MCAPVLGIMGAAVQAIGAMSAAEGQASAAEYNAKVEKINARTQRQKGYVDQEKVGDKYDTVQGQALASASKGGVDPLYGSAALIIFGENEANRSADKNTTYVNAEGQATAHENKAKAYEQEAANHRQAGSIGAAGSFLSGLSGAVKGSGGLFNLNAG